MSAEWSSTSLGALIDIKHGFAFKGEHITDQETQNLLLTPGNFAIGGGFQPRKQKFYSGKIPDDYILAVGDLIVTMTDLSKEADTLGYSALVPKSSFLMLHNQRIGKVVPKSEDALLGFLHWVMRTPDYRNEILANYSGSTVKHTSPTKILAYKFNLPPLAEQSEIAATLDALEDKIKLNRKTAATLEGMARALYRSWFVDFDPVRARAEGRTPAHMDPATAALFPDSFGEDGLPVGWTLSSIGEVAEIVGGSTPSTKEDRFWVGGEHAWATPKDLSNLGQAFLFDTERKVTSAGLAKITSGRSPAGTLLLSSRAPIGYLALATMPVAINQGFIAIRETEAISGIEAYFWCGESMDLIHANANGSTFQEISKKNFRPLTYALAPAAIRTAYNEQAGLWFARMKELMDENRTLATLRDTLLPRLMSGALRVGAARALVEEVV
ncbi:restriction endonuclease subunit S [Paracoccus jeotgali]|uniref:Restriction endonuclease subunit S n=1 Tax=Paracoccus jeotgali TaxID=2065379 RepID=A0A2K9MDH1_9RHOB|nr:restriction endonuclease subunit S [Paracoccus jeotgali]AUM73670.1 restriction endonuclease subunit S [Paracoccus jeotgali]